MSTEDPEVGVCSHCLDMRLLDDAGVVGYHDFPVPTRQVCAGSMKPPQTPEQRIERIEMALRTGDEDDLRFLYNKDILVNGLVSLGGQLAQTYHHCKSCDGHACDV